MPDIDLLAHPHRNVIGVLATVVVLGIVCGFSWRVYHFASLIQSGTLTEADLAFAKNVTSSGKIANAPLPTGTVDVTSATAPSLGKKDAKLTIVEFADFGCPFSREESFVVHALALAYPDTVRFEYRDFPIDELHPMATAASEAARCANEQNRFWDYHDKIYANQDTLADESFPRFAAELNMNVGEFNRCLASDRNLPKIQADVEAGVVAGVRGTPTFFFNGVRVPGAIPEDTFKKLIDRFLSPTT
ncbi:MAG: thioredoxin domain-containing protein [Candidatus Uhrbacteria bacterium]